MTEGNRYVATTDIRAAVKRRETDLLDALHIDWRRPKAKPHIACPYHEHADNNPSWRWDERKRKAFCTCGARDILGVLMGVEEVEFEDAKIRAAELLKRPDLIKERRARKRKGGRERRTTEQPCNGTALPGCRLIEYAAAKGLPIEFLFQLGVTEITYQGAPAVKIPYFAIDGGKAAARFRIALEGLERNERFRWRKGSTTCLYGLNQLSEAVGAGYVVLVEGESDSQTLWLNRFPALGLPGNRNWNEARDAALLEHIPIIYPLIEPGGSGEGVLDWLRRSSIAERARLVRLKNAKDPSALYLANPEGFREAFQRALDEAEPYQTIAEREVQAEATQARETAGDLVLEQDVLTRFATDLERAGLVGEDRNAKILFLALTTRLFERPVSAAIKGPSSGGKSYTVEVVLRFFPPSTYWERTAMSDRALAYSDEDFRHRHLVVYEAAGMTSDIASYLIRSLLSEGRIRYELVEKTKDGMKPRLIEKEGPTGLIVTTTAPRLHPENETRLLSLTVKDTPEQTKAVLLALASRSEATSAVDFEQWQAFQIWLTAGERRVVVPFAQGLAELIPPIAVRLRRDFRLLLALIEAHALLHREQRGRDDKGRILATFDDYAAVRELVADLFAEGVEASVKQQTRETVAAVRALGKDEVSLGEIAKELKLDKGATSRRVNEALTRGYLSNAETRKGRPARISLGDPLPHESEILPSPQKLAERCTVAALQEEIDTPSPRSELDAAADIPAFAELEIG